MLKKKFKALKDEKDQQASQRRNESKDMFVSISQKEGDTQTYENAAQEIAQKQEMI
jgi:hypothetical protein